LHFRDKCENDSTTRQGQTSVLGKLCRGPEGSWDEVPAAFQQADLVIGAIPSRASEIYEMFGILCITIVPIRLQIMQDGIPPPLTIISRIIVELRQHPSRPSQCSLPSSSCSAVSLLSTRSFKSPKPSARVPSLSLHRISQLTLQLSLFAAPNSPCQRQPAQP
jgi:hypothetical protein